MLLLIGALCGCAPPGTFYETGSFVPRPRDACALPETAADFAASLNQRVGQQGGPRQQVNSMQGLAAVGVVVESRYQFDQCHGMLVYANGQTETGVVGVRGRDGQRVIQASWESDETIRKRLADEQASIAEAQRKAQIERTAAERPTPIESDAVMYEKTKEWLAQTEKLVRFVRANSFSCDSVSASRPMLMARGYVLVCNRFSYTYDVQDKGGNWIVSVR